MVIRVLALLCAIIAVASADEQLGAIAARQGGRAPCGRKCRFSFCRGRQIIRFLGPGKASTPLICRINQDIAAILEIGENLVVPRGEDPIRISKWRPDGLKRKFRKKFFRPRPVAGQENYGLVRSVAKQNQNDFIDGRCFIMPILKYERVRSNGSIRVVETNNPERDCLAFEVRAAKIQIEVQWFSGDDFDLAVTEPDGTVLNNANDKSSCGEFGSDAGVDACGIREEGAEKIFYNPDCASFQTGKYKAVLKQAANCGNGPTNWEMRLVIDGRIVQKKKGTSNEDEGKRVGVMRFRL